MEEDEFQKKCPLSPPEWIEFLNSYQNKCYNVYYLETQHHFTTFIILFTIANFCFALFAIMIGTNFSEQISNYLEIKNNK